MDLISETCARFKSFMYANYSRSAEKTDFTYANSYSYRTEVTPERVICMPNMTRRSIERCHGFGFSSPELRLGTLGKTPGITMKCIKVSS
jgi:hypothetical protein